MTDFAAWKLAWAKATRDAQQRAVDKVGAIILSGYEHATLISPVDTGRYRGAHQISMDAPATSEPPAIRSVEDAKTEEAAHLVLTTDRKEQKVHISNPVAYAGALEHGHSKQAPAGVYSVVRERLQRLFVEAAR